MRGRAALFNRTNFGMAWPVVVVTLGLLAGPAVGTNAQVAHEPAVVEQLETVEVTASRIAPPKRVIPLPLPEMSASVPLPPEGMGIQLQVPLPSLPQSRELLRDETAATKGVRTRVRYMDSMRPPYPRRAREMGWEGTVVLRVEVKTDGTVGEIVVRRTSGHVLLDDAALTAVRRWRFVPPTDGAFTLSAVVDVPVRFDLRDKSATQEELRRGS